MPDAIDDLIALWKRENTPLNPGASADQLDAFERDFAVSLPADFRKLYSLANGMADYDSDSAFLSLWSLSRVRKEPAGVHRHSGREHVFITFADWMISAPEYAWRCGNDGSIAIVAPWYGVEDLVRQEVIADSILDFARLRVERGSDFPS